MLRDIADHGERRFAAHVHFVPDARLFFAGSLNFLSDIQTGNSVDE
jgi:hypothetical protein